MTCIWWPSMGSQGALPSSCWVLPLATGSTVVSAFHQLESFLPFRSGCAISGFQFQFHNFVSPPRISLSLWLASFLLHSFTIPSGLMIYLTIQRHRPPLSQPLSSPWPHLPTWPLLGQRLFWRRTGLLSLRRMIQSN